MPHLVLDILRDYPGVPGLFVASVYSGTLSTVSSSINALATVTVEDLVKPYFKMSDRKLSWTSKGLNVLYGALYIGVAGMASLMDSLIQGSLVGLVCGLCLTLWVGIGAQLYPQLPEKAMSLSLSTANCNFSFITQAFNKTFPTQLPLLTTAVLDPAPYRPYLADNWYSLSFMYFLHHWVSYGCGCDSQSPYRGEKAKLGARTDFNERRPHLLPHLQFF